MWRVTTSRSCGSTAPDCTNVSRSLACVIFTSVSWSWRRPLRRPSSRSLANGGPPTFMQIGGPSPITTERSGFRAWIGKVAGAFATCSITQSGS